MKMKKIITVFLLSFMLCGIFVPKANMADKGYILQKETEERRLAAEAAARETEEIFEDENDCKNSGEYIGNKRTKKFHYDCCSSVDLMKENNMVFFYTRREALYFGYVPCQKCCP